MVAQPSPTPLAVLRLAIAPLPSDGEKRLAEARVPAGSTAAGARARCRGTGAWSCGGSRTPSACRCPSPSDARGSSRWPSSSISLLCDAEIALIVFSPAGMLYEYASTSRVEPGSGGDVRNQVTSGWAAAQHPPAAGMPTPGKTPCAAAALLCSSRGRPGSMEIDAFNSIDKESKQQPAKPDTLHWGLSV